jgi:two-component system, NtrC family, sensor kinase
MTITCPRCKALHEISGHTPLAPITCSCGEEFLFEPPARRRVPSRRKLIQCSRCNRIYDPREMKDGKKVCLTCGNIITVKETEPLEHEGRKGDRQVTYARTEMRALLEMCTLMSSSFDRDTILSEIMKITNDILQSEGSSIILLDVERGEMIFHSTAGSKSEQLKKRHLKIGEGIAGHVFRTKTSLIVNNVRKDPNFCAEVDNTIKFHTRNLLCVPLLVGDHIIGVLEAVNKKERSLFDDYDLKIAEALASQAALAIEKARLIQESILSERLVAIGQTVSNLSFCIKNILTNLEGWASNMDNAIEEKDRENQAKSWTMVRKSISRISDLVSDMVLYSSQKPKELGFVMVNDIIDEIVDLLRENAQSRQVSLTTDCEPSIPPSLLHDKNLYRAVLNLTINALEACEPQKGSVEIHSSMNPQDNSIFIEIIDNGQGIMPENLERIFTVFYTTRGFEHSGLGLTIAKKILEEQGGGIAVESHPGKGTRFLIKLPIREE